MLVCRFIARQTNFSSAGIVLGVGMQSMAAFWALMWALPKSNWAFFAIFVVDALLRVVVLGLVTYWLGSRHLAYTAPLLTLAFSYMFLSFVQIPFFYRTR